jgi:4-diphosphocytidyl-2-C-methyl-D-erythritol kinase
VVGRRDDGYHILDSLVCFPGIADVLEAEPAEGLSLTLTGPFGDVLSAGPDNLVLRAAERVRPGRAGAALRLWKGLPVAAGIGGGSADAAAALRLLARLWGVQVPDWQTVLALGADVPVCMDSRPVRMGGIGERLVPVGLPEFWIVLVNPRRPVPTARVFAALTSRENPPMPHMPLRFADAEALIEYLRATRNDLELAALSVEPSVGDVLAALGAQAGCGVARMSGSGATCFGLFASEAPARAAAAAVQQARPAWWVAVAPGALTADPVPAAAGTRP